MICYLIFKIRGKIDLKINWSVKMSFHWDKVVARSVSWDPGNVKELAARDVNVLLW